MRILQLTSDWKWTGPAEPMLQLALGQQQRGHELWLGCPVAPASADRSVGEEAKALGLVPSFEVPVGRGVRPLGDRPAVRALVGFLEEHRIDIIHTWHTRDHVLALRAVARSRGARPPSVIRSYRLAEAIADRPWNRWLFGRRTDGLLCVSPQTARMNEELRGGRPIRGAFGAIDAERFQPAPPDLDVRAEMDLPPKARVVGIVARAQSHRRFDLLLDAAALLAARDPSFHLLIVGRGTKRRELAEEPAERMGLSDRVHFAGYRRGDYADVIRCIDVFTFLVPGSDGTCRALLEAASCGIPAVVTRRGALPEIVLDEETGILVEEDAEALANAWERLISDAALRHRLGANARKGAVERFTAERLADDVEALYREARP